MDALLTMAAERLPDERRERLVGLLTAGDPKGEVKLTWHAKEVAGRSMTTPTSTHSPAKSTASP